MLRQRKRVDCLNGGEEQRLLAAFEALRCSEDPASNYTYWASMHYHCPHGSDLFLPWHRAYIFALEDALRAATGDNSLTLPYWDWIETPRVPKLFNEKPLYCERYEDPRPPCLKLPSKDDVRKTMEQQTFQGFGGSGECDGEEADGCLENVHGYVHFWVGPVMKDIVKAAFDPIFWFHHANVDRLWTLWQRANADGPLCVDRDLFPIPGKWKVRDVLYASSPRLGYEYVVSAQNVHQRGPLKVNEIEAYVDVPPNVTRLAVHLRHIHATKPGAIPALLEVYVDGADRPGYTVSLFGVHPSDHDHVQQFDHGSGHHHQFSARFELTIPSSDRPTRRVMRLAVNCPPPNEKPAPIAIEEILISFLDDVSPDLRTTR